MNVPHVNSIQSLSLGVRNLDASELFYERTWGLGRTHASGSKSYFASTGTDHHILSLVETGAPALLEITFSAASVADVQALHKRAEGFGVTVERAPAERAGVDGGGFGFSIRSPDGQLITIATDTTQNAGANRDAVPSKLSHIVLNSADMPRMTVFFADVLGFRLSDTTDAMTFIRCSKDHHSVALAKSEGPSVNHIAFEMPDLDALMSGAGRLRRHGFEIEWGVGRHGPGNNIFSYFIEPNGFVLEYTTEMEQIEDDIAYEPKSVEYWRNFPKRPCRWEMALRPSDKLIRAFSGKALGDGATHNITLIENA